MHRFSALKPATAIRTAYRAGLRPWPQTTRRSASRRTALGDVAGSRRPPVGRADPAVAAPISRSATERFQWRRPVDPRPRRSQESAALANGDLGQLPPDKVDLIVRAAQEVIDGRSGTPNSRWWCSRPARARRRNMNANEVIANRAIRDGGRRARLQDAHPSQRRREPRPVLERHLPDRHAHRGGRGDRARPLPGRDARCATRSTARRRRSPTS